MYGIGLVARLGQVSVRTLRHYDDLGLLKPSHVDPLTGYRHYTPEQVLRLHRILVLRDLGVPLAQIGRLIDEDMTVEHCAGFSGSANPRPAPGWRRRPSSSSGSRSGSRNLRRLRRLTMR
jgi:DNA-binding transcriptional MerR regulator